VLSHLKKNQEIYIDNYNTNINLYIYYMIFDFIYISESLVVLSVDHLDMNKTINYIRIIKVEEVITKVLNFEGDLH
jgi:hypothetical protein